MRTLSKELQEKITPKEALEILQEGNKRFVQNLKVNRNLLEQVNNTSEGQWPFEVILSCIDSRTSAELIFDQGLGDIFSVRIAGNVINDDILGSMEFACKIAGSKFILVLGHTKCGAVKGACDHVEMGHLSKLLSKIQPAVQAEKTTTENRTSANPEFVENVSRINVIRNVEEILNRSNIIREMVEEGKIGICGAMYDVTSGNTEFYEETVIINEPKGAELMMA
ncbi:carbonic anhydrase family protein [Segetibacter aerophilus]|uniref:Carbonic anhydrase n=1 Tax=Segetibacter aerophilus TaxID=670293 RepID=A0A512BJ80_9BACT|nr:carbonic anhydrase family protein [Segetibacter aerophilus]GEO12021.1 carbonic anhydrase [Segetibacter aerophilus]